MVDLPIPMLGYDARIKSAEVDHCPCSADGDVWTSFTEKMISQTWEGFQYLWCDLPDLVLEGAKQDALTTHQLVGIARLNPIIDYEDDQWQFYAKQVFAESALGEVDPHFAHASWRLEGYDVCSYYLWSALHRAPYDPEDRHDQVALSQQRLNSKGLLNDLRFACHFALEMNNLEGSRAPYFPYAVFTMPWP